MAKCGCGDRAEEHHPSIHHAEERDALMLKVGEFMDESYPVSIFGESFNRDQCALIAACFTLKPKWDAEIGAGD